MAREPFSYDLPYGSIVTYIIEFDTPLGNPDSPRGQAKFYVGSTPKNRLQRRMKEHRKGTGAAITRAAKEKGINWKLIAVVDEGREFEHWLKTVYKNTPKYVAMLRKQGKTLH